MSEKVWIKFVKTRVVEDARKGTPNEERYEEGRVYALPLNSANRWLARGVAVLSSEQEAEQQSKAETHDDTDDDGKPESIDDLRAAAEALGIEVNDRWGIKRLRDEIARKNA